MVNDVHLTELIVDAPKEVTLDPSTLDAALVSCGTGEVVFDDVDNVSLVQQTHRSVGDAPHDGVHPSIYVTQLVIASYVPTPTQSFEFCPEKENLHTVDDRELFRSELPAVPHQLPAFAADAHLILLLVASPVLDYEREKKFLMSLRLMIANCMVRELLKGPYAKKLFFQASKI